MEHTRTVFACVTVVLFIYYCAFYAVNTVLLIASIAEALRQPRRNRLRMDAPPESLPPVTVIAPAHNEAATIAESVRSLLALDYQRLELIVVNDGSTDATLERLIEAFALRPADIVTHARIATKAVRGIYLSTSDPRLLVIDKAQGGKSDAMNAGVNLCRTPWFCVVDADSILEADALQRAIVPAVEDSRVVASGGIVRIANGCAVTDGRVLRVGLPAESLPRFQVVEYLQDFLAGRSGWSRFNGLLLISGAFGVFRTDVIRAIGGYATTTVAEDLDLVVRIHAWCLAQRIAYRIVFVSDPVCWTEVPRTFAGLRSQRQRWHRGLAEVLARHRRLFFAEFMGRQGGIALPYYFLTLISPIAYVFGLPLLLLGAALDSVSAFTVALYILVSACIGTCFAMAAVVLEEITYRRYVTWREFFILVFYAAVQHGGYQQLVAWWRIEGLWHFLRKRRAWGTQVRTGFQTTTVPGGNS